MGVLVTGGLGFIGAAYAKHLLETGQKEVCVLDAENYASDRCRLALPPERIHIVRGRAQTWPLVLNVLQTNNITEVVHFAALSHVSSSFKDPLSFTEENALGTQVLLEICRAYGKIQQFVMISTDEVYGGGGPFDETSPLRPTNPYSASKACADLLCQTYWRCYKFPVIIARANNVVGPWQHHEKLLPAVCLRLANNRLVDVEGDGLQQRAFLHVQDVVEAVEVLRQRGTLGEIYNIAAAQEHTVLEVVDLVLHRLKPDARSKEWIRFVSDRPYQDRSYKVDGGKLAKLGWSQRRTLLDAINEVLASLGALRGEDKPAQ